MPFRQPESPLLVLTAAAAAFVFLPFFLAALEIGQRFVVAAFDEFHQIGQRFGAFHPVTGLSLGQVFRQHRRLRLLPGNPIAVGGMVKLGIGADVAFAGGFHAAGDFGLIRQGVHGIFREKRRDYIANPAPRLLLPCYNDRCFYPIFNCFADMRKPQRGFARIDRVKEQLTRELAELTRTGLKDPRAGFITINDVEVSRDYSHATVYYTVLDEKTREVTAEALEHAKGFLRSELSKRISVFRTPELHFVYDSSLERGMSLSQLIDQVAAEKPVED